MDRKYFVCSLAVFSSAALLFACSTSSLRSHKSTGINKLTYHYNRQRTGWNDRESTLTPETVASNSFGLLWQTPTLDYFEGVPPRFFASPLYVDSIHLTGGQYRGRDFSVLYVVGTTGYVYAISARESG